MNPAIRYSASWLLITHEGAAEADGSGWPCGVNPAHLGVDTRYVWRLVPSDFVKPEYDRRRS